MNIDDRIPSYTYGSGFRPMFTGRSHAGAWWMPLLEKAYAKLDQNYERLTGGYLKEGIRVLTGMPATEFYHNSDYI